MPYIIDGHNLIPKIPGLKLDDVDDELQLVKLLQDFCRVSRKNVEVFFDQAPAGSSGARTYGCVVARFIRQGRTADQAIHDKLRRLGGEARNWTVVSSDQEVRKSARSARAKSMQVEEFAVQLLGLVGVSSDDLHSNDGTLSA
jgi:predicted RNA-binding protein with PIN domain